MAMINKCSSCGSAIVFGKKEGEHQYCNDICREFHRHPGFCQVCENETTEESPGGTFTVNGIGTRLYGGAGKCPTCYSVIKRKWFCVIFIPLIPFGRFRIKLVAANHYLGRKLPDEKVRESQMRTASAGK
jgi:hypothetical protein